MGANFDSIGLFVSVAILLVIVGMLGWLFFARSRHIYQNRADRDSNGRQTILVAVGSSTVSARAVELACRLAADKQAKIILTNVIEVPLRFALDASLPQFEDKARGELESAALRVRERHLEFESRVVRDRTTAGGLVNFAREAHPNMIVIGFRGSLQAGLDDLVAVSDLFRHAPCEVGVAREPIPDQEDGFRMGRLIEPAAHV